MPACVCLQETRHHGKTIRPPSGYNIITSVRVRDDDHDRGTALLIHQSINYDQIPLRTTLQATAAKIYLDKTYSICSLYLPHIPITQDQINDLVNQLPTPFLLVGDMNEKNPLWHQNITDNKGKLIEYLLNHYNVSLLNNNSPTHYHIQTDTSSIIDISLCSSDIFPSIEFSVSDTLHDSDHYPIFLTLSTDRCINFTRPIKYDTSHANWKLYKERTFINIDLSEFTTADALLDKIENTIISAADETIPKTKGVIKKPPVPWWNQVCYKAVKERQRAERALRRTYNIENKIRYNRAKARCRYVCNRAKEDSWKRYVSSLNKTTNLHKI